MSYFLVKTEPECWSWAQQVAEKTTVWDGVRNFQARQVMRQMQVGDLAFFYHTGAERRIVGIVRVIRPAYPDPTDPVGRFDAVDMEAVCALSCPVTLSEIKQEPLLSHLPLIHQGRLSVVPIDSPSWSLICHRGGVPESSFKSAP